MTNKIVHVCINIRGVLGWKDSDLRKLFLDENGKKPSAKDVRDFLLNKISEGWEALPWGEACEGFDKKTGCPGQTKQIAKL